MSVWNEGDACLQIYPRDLFKMGWWGASILGMLAGHQLYLFRVSREFGGFIVIVEEKKNRKKGRIGGDLFFFRQVIAKPFAC